MHWEITGQGRGCEDHYASPPRVPLFPSCERRDLLWIFLIAFALRLAYAFIEQIPPRSDARLYHSIALNLVQGLGFVESPGLPPEQDPAIRVSGPLFPMFLSGIYAVFGVRLWVVWIVQAFLGAITCLLLFELAQKTFDTQVARMAAILGALTFDLIIYPAMLLMETLYLFLASMGLLILFRALSSESGWFYMASGVVLGLATLTRPGVAAFVGIFCVWQARRKLLRAVIPFMLGVALVLLPWAIRNYRIYHEFFLLPTNGGIAFWLGNNPEADGSFPNVFPDSIGAKLIDKRFMLEQNRQGYAEGFRFIREHPGQYLRLLGLKLVKFLSPFRTNGWMFHMQGLDRIVSIMLSGLTSAILFSLGLLGMYLACKKSNDRVTCGLLYAVSCLLGSLIYLTHARYRLQIYPALLLFAAYGAREVWRCFMAPEGEGERRVVRRALTVAVGIVLAAMTIDGLTNAAEILRRLGRLMAM